MNIIAITYDGEKFVDVHNTKLNELILLATWNSAIGEDNRVYFNTDGITSKSLHEVNPAKRFYQRKMNEDAK